MYVRVSWEVCLDEGMVVEVPGIVRGMRLDMWLVGDCWGL
jgi:hypothetical protein